MDEYADIYYVDEGRNAVRDHRTPSSGSGAPTIIRSPSAHALPARTVYVQPRPVAQPAPIYTQQPLVMQPQVMYGPAPQSTAAALFGKLTTGQIVEMVAQIFAALQSLPGAPVATKEPATDIANLVLFQNALAQHAKRDEQVRTLGSLVAKLVG